MRYIYFCWGGAHSSVAAAAIHLGHLPMHARPTHREIIAAPRFDQAANADIGGLVFMGRDERGNGVYTLGLGSAHRHLRGIINTAIQLAGVEKEQYRFVNCLPCINTATRIGGFLSRSAGLVKIGRPLVAWGVRRSFNNYQKLVRKVKSSPLQTACFLDWHPPI